MKYSKCTKKCFFIAHKDHQTRVKGPLMCGVVLAFVCIDRSPAVTVDSRGLFDELTSF